jgi:hypothetical protein
MRESPVFALKKGVPVNIFTLSGQQVASAAFYDGKILTGSHAGKLTEVEA